MYPQLLHKKRFFKYQKSAFPKALDNKDALFLGQGSFTQCFYNPGEDFVYLRSCNNLLESIDLFTDFTDEDHIHVPRVERLNTESLEYVKWYKMEKLETLRGDNLKLIRKFIKQVRNVVFNPDRYKFNNAILQLIETHYPQFYPSIEELSYRAQDWDSKYRFEFITCNIMQRSDGTIVFNDIIAVNYNYRTHVNISKLPYEKLVEYEKARPYND